MTELCIFPSNPQSLLPELAFVEHAMNVQEYSVNAWYCSPLMLLIAFIVRQKKVRCSQCPTHSVGKVVSLQTSDLFGEHLPGARWCG